MAEAGRRCRGLARAARYEQRLARRWKTTGGAAKPKRAPLGEIRSPLLPARPVAPQPGTCRVLERQLCRKAHLASGFRDGTGMAPVSLSMATAPTRGTRSMPWSSNSVENDARMASPGTHSCPPKQPFFVKSHEISSERIPEASRSIRAVPGRPVA